MLKLEELNETFHFNFAKDRGIETLTNGAYYLCIKKAFTPFAAMHMLKQIQMARSRKHDVKLTENKPLVDYTLNVPNPDPIRPDSPHSFPDSVYRLEACVTSRSLKQLTCSCAFYKNYQMVCWHQLHLLEKLQIKNMGAFEHLRKWREFVGYKSLNTNDKRTTKTYKVKKEKRLKSFIELVTKKHMKRLKAAAKEKGIDLRSKHAGQQLSSGEENEWEELNKEVRDKEDAAAAQRRQKAKDKRL